jgi:type I restriction enzyme S subunit
MKKYPKYKDSGVEWIGEMPEGWQLIKIKNTCEIANEQISQSELNGKQVIHYSIPNVQESGIGQLEDGDDIDSSKILIKGGEILFSKLNPRKGTTCIVAENDEYLQVCSGEFITMIPKTNHPKFHLAIVSCSTFIQYIDSQVESVTRSHQRVRPENFLSSFIPVPPIQEQQKIVTYLDKKNTLINQIISCSEKKIELLKEQRTATINHAVTKGLNPKVKMKDSGVEWIGEIPEGWEVKKNKFFLNSFDERSSDGSEELLSVSEYRGIVPRKSIKTDEDVLTRAETLEGYRKVKIGNLVSNIMLTWKRGLGVSDLNGIVSPAYSVFDFIESNPKYFHFLFRTDQYTSEFKRNSTGVIESRLRMYDDTFLRLKSHFPSLQEQQQIVTYLDQKTKEIDDLISSEQKRIELMKEYRQSLISDVVTGKINVTIP